MLMDSGKRDATHGNYASCPHGKCDIAMIGSTVPGAGASAAPIPREQLPQNAAPASPPMDAIALCGHASYGSMVINCRGREGRTQLHEAAEAGDTARVMELLQRGADVFMRDENGATARWLADENQRSDVVATIDDWKCRLMRQFIHVAGLGDAAAVQHFSDNTSISYSERVQVLTAAAQGGGVAAVERLLETFGFAEQDLDSLVHAGVGGNSVEQLLLGKMLFARVNHWTPRQLQAFLERYPHLDLNRTWSGSSALHHVVRYGEFPEDLGKVRVLLDAGAAPSVVDGDGFTADALASVKGMNEVVAVLLKQDRTSSASVR